MCEMDADLMRAARFEAEREEGKSVFCAKGFVVRDGRLSGRRDHAFDDAAGAACDGRIDCAARLGRCAFDDGEVDALYAHLVGSGKQVLYVCLLGDEHESARLAVEAVHGMEGMIFAVRFVVEEYGVGEGSPVLAVRRMHEHACGFVDDEEGIVLVTNVYGDVCGSDATLLVQLPAKLVATLDAGARGIH